MKLFISFKMISNVRWAFNVAKWEPSEKELLLASSCLQNEEKNRIDRFVFKKDAKSSLAGRLMIRKFVSENSGLPYNSVHISRDSNNKPVFYSNNLESSPICFNVSHHGSYTVLAGAIGYSDIGVDVMKLEYSGGKTVSEFFRIMNRNFSALEWSKIKGSPGTSETEQIETFCRIWALKESYVKAIGKGITLDLGNISFDIHSSLRKDEVITDTSLYINNIKQPWVFEESLIDSSHCAAVALENKNFNKLTEQNVFKHITASELLQDATPLLPEDVGFCKRFFLKE